MSTREEKFHTVAEKSREQAQAYLLKGNAARAFSHFLVALKLEPNCIGEVAPDFIYALRELGLQLETSRNYDELFNCYKQALDVSPSCYQIHNNFGAHLFRLGQVDEASVYFLNALKLNSEFLPAKDNLDNASNTLVERWHFPMLNDKSRNMAFRSAIHNAVAEGYRSVLDIGSGTGILSMFATERAEDVNVYACEMSKVMHAVSYQVLEANELCSRINLLNCHSSEMTVPQHLPARVELVVTETVDCGLLGENILPTLSYAWKHLLASPSNSTDGSLPGKVIPRKAVVKACVIECEYVRKQSQVLISTVGGLDLKTLKYATVQDEDPYLAEKLDKLPGGYRYLCEPVTVLDISFQDVEAIDKYIEGHSHSVELKISSDGTADAIAAWFELHLDEKNVISTRSQSCWEQAIYPVELGRTSEVAENSLAAIEITVNGEYMKLNFTPNVERDKIEMQNSPPGFEFLKISRLDLRKANDGDYWSAVFDCLKTEVSAGANVLDDSSVPFGGLMALRLGAGNVAISSDCNYEAALEIASFNCLGLARIRRKDGVDVDLPRWDILMLDVVEPNGLLKQDVLEDLAVMGRLYLKPTSVIIPRSIVVHAVAVESAELLEMNRLVDDESVGNFHVADIINIFKVSVHCDVQMSATEHRALTAPTEVLRIPLTYDVYNTCANIDLANVTDIDVASDGSIHGTFVWFTLKLNDEVEINTCDPNCHWKQSCFVLNEALPVRKGDRIQLSVSCKHSTLNIKLKQA